MKNLYYTYILFLGFNAFSQPTLNYTNPTFVPGYSATISKAWSNFPGSAGENINWDFSNFTVTNTETVDVVNPDQISIGFLFNTCNIAFTQNNKHHFYQSNSDSITLFAEGITSTESDGDYRLDPIKIATFPMNYDDYFIDYYNETNDNHNVVVRYDGYGTINLPGGVSYSNVVRIIESYNEDNIFSNVYRWYTVDPFLNVAIHDGRIGVLSWLNGGSTNSLNNIDMNDASLIFDFASNQLLTLYDKEYSIDLYDLSGKIILSKNNLYSTATISLDAINKGSYVCVLKSGTEIIKTIKIVL